MTTANPILLVEDNVNDEALTTRAIRRSNIHNDIVVARDGAEALERLASMELPELVLLDLKLPKIDGLEVLRRIRSDERTKHLPVVIFTSSREQQDVQQAYRGGVNSYVCKPIDFGEFVNAVGQLSQYWMTINEAPGGGRRFIKRQPANPA